MRNDNGFGLILILFLLVLFAFLGFNKADNLEKRLNWLEADHNNLKWDYDKLKMDQGK